MSDLKVGDRIRLTTVDDELTNFWGLSVGSEGVVESREGFGYLVTFDKTDQEDGEPTLVFPEEFEVIS